MRGWRSLLIRSMSTFRLLSRWNVRLGPVRSLEKDLIDAPWVQRLRYINQLQSARWVFPGAEHSRFQHSLGAMHVAGRFARQLYPSLCALEPSCPSLPYVEEVLRMAALLHDVGHGPFGHFFDENHLAQYGIGHEAVGAHIITHALDEALRGLRRSPSGPFAPQEVLEPGVCGLRHAEEGPGQRPDATLVALSEAGAERHVYRR